MERNAFKIAVLVHNIIEDVKYWDSPALGLKMFRAFGCWTFAQEHPDMTASLCGICRCTRRANQSRMATP